MNLLEAIVARRATRQYSPRDVDATTIESLLRAAVQAPSAMNLQPWWFSVIQDRARLKRYSDRAKRRFLEQLPTDPRMQRYEAMLRDEAFNIFYDAGTLIVVGSIQRGPFHDADCWLAAENLMLAACAEGLATCCIGFAVEVLNEPEVKAELHSPTDGVAVAPIILGYPRGTTPAVPRAEPRIASWIRALPANHDLAHIQGPPSRSSVAV